MCTATNLIALTLAACGALNVGAPAIQTTNGAAVASQSAPDRPPLWKVYYDDGVRAMRNRQYEEAISHLVKARNKLSQARDRQERLVLLDVYSRLGTASTELAAEKRKGNTTSLLHAARRHFRSAVGLARQLHEADSLELADVIERYADCGAAVAEMAPTYSNFVAWIRDPNETYIAKGPTVADLYLEVLHIREKALGETDSAVMLYRRKIMRAFYGWIRRARELRANCTDKESLYNTDPIVDEWRSLADELKQRDRDLQKLADATSNG